MAADRRAHRPSRARDERDGAGLSCRRPRPGTRRASPGSPAPVAALPGRAATAASTGSAWAGAEETGRGRRSSNPYGCHPEEARQACPQAAHTGPRQEAASHEDPIAPPSRALGTRDGRGRPLSRDAALARLGRRRGRGDGRRRRSRARSGSPPTSIPLVLIVGRRADARPQQDRRPEAVPHRARRRSIRADDRPRPRRGRRDRRRPRRRSRPRGRRHRRADRRRRALHRRHAAVHRCLGRRRPPPLRHARCGRAGSAARRSLDGLELPERGRAGSEERAGSRQASATGRRRRELSRRDRAGARFRRAAAARDARPTRTMPRRGHRRRRRGDRLRGGARRGVPPARALAC